jgi:hypothetical protein
MYASDPSDPDTLRYVLLITDGDPSCASSKDTCHTALDATASLGNKGVQVVVLNVGPQPTPSCLVQISQSGRSWSTGDFPQGNLFVAATTSELASKLQGIASTIAKGACSVEVNRSLPAADRVNVFFDTQTVAYDVMRANGWAFANSDNSRINLYGSACAQLLATPGIQVSVSYTCSTCGGTYSCRWQ